ncbi:LOC107762755 [Symbiodinium necroappetens]|uniref:LOC107762755 protein n=1 Tax=Symbiodinium necroappetens TaxID=1628268 RepID=A0A812ST85_9DINO|nr:LOC107762755 [Symbiodinium necroappetens]
MGGRTHFTVLVYLNGGERDPKDLQVRGGETVFWKDHDGKRPALAFPPTRGVCLFHGHGDEWLGRSRELEHLFLGFRLGFPLQFSSMLHNAECGKTRSPRSSETVALSWFGG